MNTQITNFQDKIIAVTPVCDTSAYGAGDTLFDATAIAIRSSLETAPILGRVASVIVLDKDDQAAAGMDLYFFNAAVTFGTANAAPSISDADAAKLIGRVRLTAGDWTDLGGSKVADLHNLNLPFRLETGSLYVAGVTAGTPTQTASGLVLTVSMEIQQGLN